MSSLEALRQNLDSLDDLAGIVRTMKTLAAVSIRQYERAAQALADYQSDVQLALAELLRQTQWPTTPNLSGHEYAVIALGSDRGLCGRFNESLAEVLQQWRAQHSAHHSPALYVMGERLANVLQAQGWAVQGVLNTPNTPTSVGSSALALLQVLLQWQDTGIEQVCLFYNQHNGGQAYQAQQQTLLPPDLGAWQHHAWPTPQIPGHAIPASELLTALVQELLLISLQHACVASLASEHTSRLMAMQAAQRNLEERQGEVLALFRQTRQQAITEELLDVVAGFEALHPQNSSKNAHS